MHAAFLVVLFLQSIHRGGEIVIQLDERLEIGLANHASPVVVTGRMDSRLDGHHSKHRGEQEFHGSNVLLPEPGAQDCR